MKKFTILAVLFLLTFSAKAQSSNADLIQRSPLNTVLEGSELTISHSHLQKPVTARIHDITGRIVFTREDIGDMETVNMEGAPRGIYLIAVCGSGGDCRTSKITKR